MKHRMRVEVYVDGLRVTETEASYDREWNDFSVFVAQGSLQRFLHRIARGLSAVCEKLS